MSTASGANPQLRARATATSTIARGTTIISTPMRRASRSRSRTRKSKYTSSEVNGVWRSISKVRTWRRFSSAAAGRSSILRRACRGGRRSAMTIRPGSSPSIRRVIAVRSAPGSTSFNSRRPTSLRDCAETCATTRESSARSRTSRSAAGRSHRTSRAGNIAANSPNHQEKKARRLARNCNNNCFIRRDQSLSTGVEPVSPK